MPFDLKTVKGETDERVDQVYAWTATRDAFYAHADLQITRGLPGWVNGFVKIRRMGRQRLTDLLEYKLPSGDPMQTFYRLNLHLFATDGTTAYILVMQQEPYFLVAREPALESKLVPMLSACGSRPRVPAVVMGVDGLVEAYKSIAQSEGPIGVYTQGGGVYLLCRLKAADGGLRFFLRSVNTTTGESGPKVAIDSAAANLAVVPGPIYWAFVEKDEARASDDGKQLSMHVKSLLFVPRTMIEAGLISRVESPLRSEVPASGVRLLLWIARQIPWIFSGIGVFLLAVVVEVYRRKRRGRPRKV